VTTPDQPTRPFPQQPGPYPPPPHPPVPGPYGFYPPPRKKSFWSSTGGILIIVFGSIGLVVLLCGGLAVVGAVGERNAVKKIDVELTSCGGTGSVAKVGYSVTNNGDKARRVRIDIEYRDSSGARLDTDTAYVGSVPAHDTVRGEESTFLNATPSDGSITCKVAKVH